MNQRLFSFVALFGLIALLAGCRSTQPPAAEPQVDPMSVDVPKDPAMRIAALKIKADQLASLADQLPGRDEEAYRPLMSKALAELAQSLRLATDLPQSGAFAVQLYTIYNASTDLLMRPITDPARPQTTAALRSAHNALRDIQRRRFAENTDLQNQLQKQEEALSSLENQMGAMYRLSSSEALREAVKTLGMLATAYAGQIPSDAAAASETTPDTAPVTPNAQSAPAQSAPAEPQAATAPLASPAPAPASSQTPRAVEAPKSAERPEMNK